MSDRAAAVLDDARGRGNDRNHRPSWDSDVNPARLTTLSSLTELRVGLAPYRSSLIPLNFGYRVYVASALQLQRTSAIPPQLPTEPKTNRRFAPGTSSAGQSRPCRRAHGRSFIPEIFPECTPAQIALRVLRLGQWGGKHMSETALAIPADGERRRHLSYGRMHSVELADRGMHPDVIRRKRCSWAGQFIGDQRTVFARRIVEAKRIRSLQDRDAA